MFFKTNNPDVLTAWDEYATNRTNLRENADAFAEAFNADAVILSGGSDIYFGGIVFRNNTEINRDIWCKPDRQFKTSSLRVRALKKELQEEWKAERAKWDELHAMHFPNGTRVKKYGIYKSLGFDWGNLFFNGFGAFKHNDTIYIDTSIIIKNAVEILGSEYAEAKAIHEKGEAA
ncbi:hypothetical protein [Acinetobacter sp. BSP-28]|uniref:hypothetical protein n=1 Tax=Acinetobacter sp. BSP-28 TaxID=3344661 RepID=UPI0037703AC7